MRAATIILMILATVAKTTNGSLAAERQSIKQLDKVVAYPAPKGAALSDQYEVTVNGTPLDVYAAPVWEPGGSKSFGGPYSFAYFDFSGTATVQVVVRKQPVMRERLRILPESRGIQPEIAGSNLSFAVSSPCQLSIEPNAKQGPLLLFANPLEVNPPKPGDAGVIYFGPGLHQTNEIKVADNQTLYIAGGAVVKGGILAQGANIRIRGRGIIDGLDWARLQGPTHNLLRLTKCTNAMIEGIILKDTFGWTFPMYACRGVHVDNVKIMGARCENNDGIDVVNSQDVKIENCFIRSDDDNICPKGLGEEQGIGFVYGSGKAGIYDLFPPQFTPGNVNTKQNDKTRLDAYPPVENLTVERCVLWTDRAHVWRLGCECRAAAMRRLVFRDIDVLHYNSVLPAITVQPSEGMLMEDVRFENIRFNGEGQPKFIEIDTGFLHYAIKKTPGIVRNVVFKDIVLRGVAGNALIEVKGSDSNHTVEGVTFENVTRYGKRLDSDSPQMTIGPYTKGIISK